MLLQALAHSRRRRERSATTRSRNSSGLAVAASILGEGLVKLVKFRPDVVGVGVFEVGEDGQGLLPRMAGGGGVAGGVVGVAEAAEDFGFVVAVAEVSEHLDGVLVGSDGLDMLAEVLACVADAVPGGRLLAKVAEFVVQGKGLLAFGEGLAVLAKLCVEPADGVEGGGLAGAVIGRSEQFEGLSSVIKRFRVAPLFVEHNGEAEVRVGLAVTVAQLVEQLESASQMRVSLVVAVQSAVRAAEAAMAIGCASSVAGTLCGVDRGFVDQRRLVPVSLEVEELTKDPGELPGMRAEAGGGRLSDGGDQDAVFGGEPCHRFRPVGECLWRNCGLGDYLGGQVAVRLQQSAGCVSSPWSGSTRYANRHGPRAATSDLITRAPAAHVGVIAWTVDDVPTMIQLDDHGVDG